MIIVKVASEIFFCLNAVSCSFPGKDGRKSVFAFPSFFELRFASRYFSIWGFEGGPKSPNFGYWQKRLRVSALFFQLTTSAQPIFRPFCSTFGSPFIFPWFWWKVVSLLLTLFPRLIHSYVVCSSLFSFLIFFYIFSSLCFSSLSFSSLFFPFHLLA